MIEVKLIDGDSIMEFGLLPTKLDRALPASFELHFGQAMEGFGHREVFLPGLPQHCLELLGHGLEVELQEFLFEGFNLGHGVFSF